MTMTARPTTSGDARTESGESRHVTVFADRCAGCQECVVRCPTGALSMDAAQWIAVSDDTLCVGCRQCVRTCPFSAIAVEGPLALAPRTVRATHEPAVLLGNLEETRLGIRSWSDAIAEASRCLQCPDPTCVRGCPVHNDIPGFIAAVRDGDLDAAHGVLRRTTFLPDICSRVCDQAVQCEGSCSWSLAGGAPVAIGAIERFIADNAPVPPLDAVSSAGAGMEVAVVGSGPAGIAAAWELAQAGAAVTVFEKDDLPGGLLRWGIPDFTLPNAVASRPWDALVASGVDLRCNTPVGPAEVQELTTRYDAVLLAYGAGMPLRLPVEGNDLEGVWDATRFLMGARAALVDHHDLDGLATSPAGDQEHAPTVLVIGGGNTAMDVARLARRLGARAVCVEWMDRRFAPVRPDEVDEALAEGVQVRFSTTVARLVGEGGRVRAAVLDRTVQDSPRRQPTVVQHGADRIEVDLVVMAMGYRLEPQMAALTPGVPVPRRTSGVADRTWQASGLLAGGTPDFARHQPVGQLALGREAARIRAGLGVAERVWVAGDALVGPSTVVEAMAQGRRAAQAVLEHRPLRDPAASLARRPRVLVAFDSRAGHTEKAAHALADACTPGAASVTVRPITAVGVAELAAADVVVLGTWVEGLVVAGVRPARTTRAWLDSLPPLGGKPFALFCTFGVSPRGALESLEALVHQHGGRVIGTGSVGPRSDPGVMGEHLADRILDHWESAPAPSLAGS